MSEMPPGTLKEQIDTDLRKFALEKAAENFVGSDSVIDAARKYYLFLAGRGEQE